ncbi:hypothetical protein [Burkholderia ubonensis]|uniref:hypothetical protein n=1 Tax=Burkholderia ubonensis TaxID=101571 RepID=UPI0012FA9B00|nr:hypothetical protein [Burkholderia ubonensis]
MQQIQDQMAQMDLVMSDGGVLPGNVRVASGEVPQDGTEWTRYGVNKAGQTVWTQSLGPGDPDLQAYIVKGAQGSGFSYQSTTTGKSPGLFRLPDFVNFQIDYFVGSAWGTFSRDGNSYFGYGVNKAVPNSVNAAASMQFGWLNQDSVRPGQTNNFLSGYAGNGTAALSAVGGGVVYSPGNGTVTVIGVGAGANLGKTSNPASVGMVIQSIRVKQESGGNYDELPEPNTEDAGTENYLVVLFCRDDEFHCVRGVEEHLL